MALHKKKWLAIAAGSITLAVFAGILVILIDINLFKPQIEAAASSALGIDVVIKGRVGLALFPGLGLSLRGIFLRDRGSDVGTIEQMTIGLKLLPLVRSEIEISRVRLVKPAFSMVWFRNGMFNLTKHGPALWEKIADMKMISVSQGSLGDADEKSSQKFEECDVDLSIRSHLPSVADESKPLTNISFTADARCKTVQIDDLPLMDVVMSASGENGILDINPVSMNIFGGNGSGSVQVNMTGPSPHYRVIFTLNRVRIEQLIDQYSLKDNPAKAMEGPVDFSADLTAMGKSADEMKRSLNGDLSLNGENMMLYNIDIDAFIMKYQKSQNLNLVDVGAFLVAGPFGPILTKGYDFSRLYQESQGGKGVIRKLASVWQLINGVAEARDVALASKHNRIAMKGKLDFINERFLDVTIAAIDKQGCVVYSEKVHGPFRNPQIEKESVFKSIAGSILNPMKDAWKFIQDEKCAVFYSGSVAQPNG